MRVPIRHLGAASFLAALTAFPTFPADTARAPKMPSCMPKNHNEDYYPPPFIRTSTEGEALLDFRIDQRGSPRDVRVLVTGPGPKREGFAEPGSRLVNNLNCTVPNDWAKTGGAAHRYRMWIFFNLTYDCDVSPAPTAADLGVDSVIQITHSSNCSAKQASQLQRAREEREQEEREETEAHQRALSEITPERYAAARDRCRAKAGDDPLCDQLTAEDVLRSEAVAAKRQQ